MHRVFSDMKIKKNTFAVRLHLQFLHAGLFLVAAAPSSAYPITSDDVYGARNQGFSEELVRQLADILHYLCYGGGNVNVEQFNV